MKKIVDVTLGLLIVLVIFLPTANAQEGTAFRIELNNNGEIIHTSTNAATVGDFLADIGIEFTDNDRILPRPDTEITSDLSIGIISAFPVFVSVDGSAERSRHFVLPGTFVFQFVDYFSRLNDAEFHFDEALRLTRLQGTTTLNLSTITRSTSVDVEVFDYEREYVECDELLFGTQALYQAGRPGFRRVSTTIKLIGGEEVNRSIEEVTEDPISEIIRVGTMIPPNHSVSACGEIFAYSRSMIMESTAYTLSFACTGRHPDHPLFGVTASGMMAGVGIVAVDTNVIPFHTRMYIEGYGFAVAGDRGGAIRGYMVDVFKESMPEARQWGRRNVRVWILAEDEDETYI